LLNDEFSSSSLNLNLNFNLNKEQTPKDKVKEALKHVREAKRILNQAIALITTEKEGDTSKLPVLQNTRPLAVNLANKVTTSLKFKKQVLLRVMSMLFFPLVD
jgi:hypothetical protein